MQLNDYVKQAKPREHNNLATIQVAELKGAHEPSIYKNLEPKCKSQQEWTR